MRIITNVKFPASLCAIAYILTGCTHSMVDERAIDPPLELTHPISESSSTIKMPKTRTTKIPVAEAEETAEYDDVWERIRSGFTLPELNNSRVRYYEDWYRSRPEFLIHLSSRASRYLFHIIEEVESRGMPSELALLPAIESAFKPRAYSRAHAAGLWQFIPGTGRRFGLRQDWWYDERRDVLSATTAALDYLQLLHEEFDGDWFLALAAYNAGEYRVRRAIRHNRKRKRPTSFEHLSLRAETKAYVPKLLALRNLVAEAEQNDLPLHSIPNRPYFAELKLEYQIDLRIVAKLGDIEEHELLALNPSFRRWTSDPNGPHRLLVPVQARADLEAKLATLSPNERLRWHSHRIRPGETLSGISVRYGVDISALRRSNRLQGTLIRAGGNLMIPVSTAAINPKRRGRRVLHRVESGDTLWQIARKYRVYVKQVAKWNALRANDVLRPGQELVIYQN